MNSKLEEEKLLKKLKEAGLPVIRVKMVSKEDVEKIFTKEKPKERIEQ